MLIPDHSLVKRKVFLAKDVGNDHLAVLANYWQILLKTQDYCDTSTCNQVPDKSKKFLTITYFTEKIVNLKSEKPLTLIKSNFNGTLLIT